MKKQENNPIAEHAIRNAILQRWQKHEFYTSALVLGLDIGIEGIGVWLRKGPECLFRRTFLITLPQATPLAERRQLRAARKARVSRKQRERMLRDWIVRYGLLTEERVRAIWHNPLIFERVYEHRLRAITEGKSLASPEALVVCIRHLVKHRGYDYHLLFQDAEATFPWGSDIKLSDIKKWGSTGTLPDEYGERLKWTIRESGALSEDQLIEAEAVLNRAIERYKGDPIRVMLERHLKEKNHNNLRDAARGENYPRELIKAHLRMICQRHASFFQNGDFELAMQELIGSVENGVEKYGTDPESIIDHHRRTPEEAKKLWEQKEAPCDMAEILYKAGHLSELETKRSPSGDSKVRQWKTLLFLAERSFELANRERRQVSADLIRDALAYVEEDARAWATRSKRPQPKDVLNRVRKTGKLLSGKESELNKAYFDQLKDLLTPRVSRLNAKSNLASTSAAALINLATGKGTVFEPDAIRENLADYYQWRRMVQTGRGSYPQVDYLLGHSGQYESGETKDGPRREDGLPREHGILRRLFAGQLRLDTGERIDLSSRLDGKAVPDYVVIETIGDMPRNTKQRKEIEQEQKDRREARRSIVKKYGLDDRDLTDTQIRQVILFDQQVNGEGVAICPYTGQELGRDPLARDLEMEHVYPESRGGLAVMENLVLTRRETNKDKDNRTPVEWLGAQRASAWLSQMKWNPRKKSVFLWNQRECPDWQNLTRTAQLARELRSRVIDWMGIEAEFSAESDVTQRQKKISDAVRKRIGAPVGAMTAGCRTAWQSSLPDEFFRPLDIRGRTILVKNRDNLRHHMWDAGVIANIPPGDGLNTVQNGGIFVTAHDAHGAPLIRPLPELAPDMKAIEQAAPNSCFVCKFRKKKSKTARTTMQPVSLPDEEGNIWQAVTIGKEISKDGVISKLRPEDLLSQVRKAGLTKERISDSKVEEWSNLPKPIEEAPLRLKDGTPVFRLRLPLKQKPSEFARLPHINTLPTPATAVAYRSDKGHTQGTLIGMKIATDVYDRCVVWRGPKVGKSGERKTDASGRPMWVYETQLIPVVRNFHAYRLMHGKRLVIQKPEGMTEKVGEIRKGDLLLAEFGSCLDGKIKLCEPGKQPFATLWMRVESIMSTGKIQFGLAEYSAFHSTPIKTVTSPSWEPSSPDVLNRLLEATRRCRKPV